ncbi:hypothetical protein MTO96_010379 [Rhipicephalus appendiculatus]
MCHSLVASTTNQKRLARLERLGLLSGGRQAMRVHPMDGREAGTVCAVRMVDDRRLVFDPRRRWSPYASVGSKLAKASRRSFMFVQALDETKSNAHTAERTTKEMLTTLLESCGCFGEADGVSKASTAPVLEDGPGAVSLTIKELHQHVETPRSVRQTCTAVADYLEAHNKVARRLLSPNGSPVLVNDGAAEGIFSLERNGTYSGNVVRHVEDRCLFLHPKAETESDHFHGQLAYRSLVTPNRDESFMFVKYSRIGL